MKKHVLALMDSEEPYAVRFMEHINRRKASPFEVHAFTDRDKLKAYARTHRIEMLLISEHDLSEQDQVAADRTVVLTDGAGSCDLYPNICKYQAASAVMRHLRAVSWRAPRSASRGILPVMLAVLLIAGGLFLAWREMHSVQTATVTITTDSNISIQNADQPPF